MTITSERTRLDLVNEVLLSVGERETRSSASNPVAKLATRAIQDAIYSVCNGNTWSEFRRLTNASSWATDEASLPQNITRIRNVYWYLSPDGNPNTSYDYRRIQLSYVDLEEYEQQVLIPFTDNGNTPRYWAIQSRNVVKVNPYPNNLLARSKCFFEYYELLDLPVSDSSVFNCSDLFLNLIKYKACELLSSQHLGDFDQSQVFLVTYENLAKQHRKTDNGQSVKGYRMFRRNNRRTRW